MKKKIVVFTGNRAEYGLQKPIIQALKESKKFNYILIVSGSHLNKKYGNTVSEIKKDKFRISYKIKLNSKSEKDPIYTTSNISKIINELSKILKKENPEFMLVNADRFETFAACIASTQMNIPTVHVEGGDITLGGTLDDNVRHAITKLSHFHFVTNKNSYSNLIKMGEEKWRIYNSGLASNDLINRKKLINYKLIKKKFHLKKNKTAILTYHAYGPSLRKIKTEIDEIEKVIDVLLKKNFNIMATFPNNDHGSNIIINKLKKLKKKYYKKNFYLHKSLGNKLYYSLLNLSRNEKVIMLGNSSSGIKESPSFECPFINIGDRQTGRIKAENVISVICKKNKILNAVNFCLNNRIFRLKLKKLENPYYKKDTGKKIVRKLEKIKINYKLLNKKHIF